MFSLLLSNLKANTAFTRRAHALLDSKTAILLGMTKTGLTRTTKEVFFRTVCMAVTQKFTTAAEQTEIKWSPLSFRPSNLFFWWLMVLPLASK